jgi:hypothetical protein
MRSFVEILEAWRDGDVHIAKLNNDLLTTFKDWDEENSMATSTKNTNANTVWVLVGWVHRSNGRNHGSSPVVDINWVVIQTDVRQCHIVCVDEPVTIVKLRI